MMTRFNGTTSDGRIVRQHVGAELGGFPTIAGQATARPFHRCLDEHEWPVASDRFALQHSGQRLDWRPG